MSLYKMFETDTSAETEGTLLDFGDTKFVIARAGGANASFKRNFGKMIKPHKRQMENGTMSEEVASRLMAESFAETVILGWSSRSVDDNGKETWAKTIEGKDGAALKFTKENCVQLFLDLPELFMEIQSLAGAASTFRAEEVEEEAKN